MDRTLYQKKKNKNPAPCTPFAFNPNGNGHLSGVHTLQKVCALNWGTPYKNIIIISFSYFSFLYEYNNVEWIC